MKKILFIVNNRKDRSPGQRFRFEQYLAHLEENGFQCDFSPLLNEKDDKLFYAPGNYVQKVFILLKSYWKRLQNLRVASQYDVIFVFREALYTRSIFFEKQFAKRSKVIFDYDDSIWMQNVSEANKRFAFLKNAAKTKDIIRISHLIFAGNEYLAAYARPLNKNVTIIPTTIDTVEYQAKTVEKNPNIVVIGWSGSVTTIQHFAYAIPALKRIKEKYGDTVEIRVIGDGNYKQAELGIQGLPWVKATELEDLSHFDLGIMPLPDDEWAKGKCGLKGLQYMALEIPTIMSPVGVNTEIIQDGENGFLAKTEDEWVEKMSQLIENKALRTHMGKAGRKTVVDKFSVEAWKDEYVKQIGRLAKE
jgi:glycosyltransferase involved in cell wall biosynthesis